MIIRKKPGPTARYRAKRRRAETPVIKFVRAQCAERDGDCRVCDWENNPDDWHSDDLEPIDDLMCNPSQWAHLGDGKRARTRGMKPEQRHTTAKSLILCQVLHHDRYDGRAKPRMFIAELDNHGLGADGPLEFKQ